MRSVRRRLALPAIALSVLAVGCSVTERAMPEDADIPRWTSRAIPEARGDLRVLRDGRRAAIRYKGWTPADFGAFRTYAYDDARPEPAVLRATTAAGVSGGENTGR